MTNYVYMYVYFLQQAFFFLKILEQGQQIKVRHSIRNQKYCSTFN